MYACIRKHAYMQKCICTHAFMRSCVHTRIHTQIRTRTHACIHEYARATQLSLAHTLSNNYCECALAQVCLFVFAWEKFVRGQGQKWQNRKVATDMLYTCGQLLYMYINTRTHTHIKSLYATFCRLDTCILIYTHIHIHTASSLHFSGLGIE